jgi:hypothetical protein
MKQKMVEEEPVVMDEKLKGWFTNPETIPQSEI